jgi:hypothetical protein
MKVSDNEKPAYLGEKKVLNQNLKGKWDIYLRIKFVLLKYYSIYMKIVTHYKYK